MLQRFGSLPATMPIRQLAMFLGPLARRAPSRRVGGSKGTASGEATRTQPAARASKRAAPGLHRPNHALLWSCAASRRGRREPMPLLPIVPGSMSISAPWPPRRRAPPHAPAVPLRGDPLLRPPSAPPRHPSASTPPSAHLCHKLTCIEQKLMAG